MSREVADHGYRRDDTSQTGEFDFGWFESRFDQSLKDVTRTFPGRNDTISVLLACLIAKGHILLEDGPGVGKTLLASQLAALIRGTKRVVGFTADLLPSELIGYEIHGERQVTPQFMRGAIFTNVFVADGLNRAAPRVQAALLDAMDTGYVFTVLSTHRLPDPFFVIATQHPNDEAGLFDLPKAQLDRFMVRVSLGYPPKEVEANLIVEPIWNELPRLLYPARTLDLRRMRAVASRVHISPSLANTYVEWLERTRHHPDLRHGVSPRAGRTVARLAQVWAAKDGRGFALPDHLQAVAVPAFSHRVELTPEAMIARQEPAEIIRQCFA